MGMQDPGMIERALRQLWPEVADEGPKDRVQGVTLSVMEMRPPSGDKKQATAQKGTKVKLYDLCAPTAGPDGVTLARRLKKEMSKVAGAQGLTEVEVGSPAGAMDVIGRALPLRRVADNGVNVASSRSHCVVSITVRWASGTTQQLQFLDLAGDEATTGNAEAAAEGPGINVFLANLSRLLLEMKNNPESTGRGNEAAMMLHRIMRAGGNVVVVVHLDPNAELARTRQLLKDSSSWTQISPPAEKRVGDTMENPTAGKRRRVETELNSVAEENSRLRAEIEQLRAQLDNKHPQCAPPTPISQQPWTPHPPCTPSDTDSTDNSDAHDTSIDIPHPETNIPSEIGKIRAALEKEQENRVLAEETAEDLRVALKREKENRVSAKEEAESMRTALRIEQEKRSLAEERLEDLNAAVASEQEKRCLAEGRIPDLEAACKRKEEEVAGLMAQLAAVDLVTVQVGEVEERWRGECERRVERVEKEYQAKIDAAKGECRVALAQLEHERKRANTLAEQHREVLQRAHEEKLRTVRAQLEKEKAVVATRLGQKASLAQKRSQVLARQRESYRQAIADLKANIRQLKQQLQEAEQTAKDTGAHVGTIIKLTQQVEGLQRDLAAKTQQDKVTADQRRQLEAIEAEHKRLKSQIETQQAEAKRHAQALEAKLTQKETEVTELQRVAVQVGELKAVKEEVARLGAFRDHVLGGLAMLEQRTTHTATGHPVPPAPQQAAPTAPARAPLPLSANTHQEVLPDPTSPPPPTKAPIRRTRPAAAKNEPERGLETNEERKTGPGRPRKVDRQGEDHSQEVGRRGKTARVNGSDPTTPARTALASVTPNTPSVQYTAKPPGTKARTLCDPKAKSRQFAESPHPRR